MKINDKLNLVVPIEREDSNAYVHSIPVSYEVFEQFYAPMSKAFSVLTAGGINTLACVGTAKLALKDAAGDQWESVQKGFINEIRRLSSLSYVGANGWESVLLADAINRKLIDDEELREVENAIVFFTLVWWLFRKAQRPMMMAGLELAGLQFTSFASTDFTNSLLTLTAPATTETEPTSFIPS